MASHPAFDVGNKIKAATEDLDISALEEENAKELKMLEAAIPGGGNAVDDPDLLKELKKMGYTSDGDCEDDEEAELKALWEAEHGSQPPASNPVPQQAPKPSKPASKPPAPKRVKTDSGNITQKTTVASASKRVSTASRQKARAVITQRFKQYKNLALKAKKAGDLLLARDYLTQIKIIKAINAKFIKSELPADKALAELPPFPPPPKSVLRRQGSSNSKLVASQKQKTTSKGKIAQKKKNKRAVSVAAKSAAGKRVTTRKKEKMEKVRSKSEGAGPAGKRGTSLSKARSTEGRAGRDNPNLSIRDNLQYATMIEKGSFQAVILMEECNSQAVILMEEAKGALTRKDKETARKLVRLRVQSLKDRDLLITAQSRGARPPTYSYETLQVQKLNTHTELKDEDICVYVTKIITNSNHEKEGAYVVVNYTLGLPKPGRTGTQSGSTGSIKVKQGETTVDHKHIFAFKRSSRMMTRRFDRLKLALTIAERAKMALFFGNSTFAKGELKLSDLKTRSDMTATIPLSKNGRGNALIYAEVKVELRDPLEGKDFRPFPIEHLVLNDDFSFPDQNPTPNPNTDPNQPEPEPEPELEPEPQEPVEEAEEKHDETESKALEGKSEVKTVEKKVTAPKVTSVTTPKKPKVRPLPPGVTLEEIKDPNCILRYRSFDALEAEMELINKKLIICKKQRKPTKALLTRKQQAEILKDSMIMNVQEGKMSFGDYLDLLKITIDHDTLLAKEVEVRRGDEGKADLTALLARLEIMRKELKKAQESGEPE